MQYPCDHTKYKLSFAPWKLSKHLQGWHLVSEFRSYNMSLQKALQMFFFLFYQTFKTTTVYHCYLYIYMCSTVTQLKYVTYPYLKPNTNFSRLAHVLGRLECILKPPFRCFLQKTKVTKCTPQKRPNRFQKYDFFGRHCFWSPKKTHILLYYIIQYNRFFWILLVLILSPIA